MIVRTKLALALAIAATDGPAMHAARAQALPKIAEAINARVTPVTYRGRAALHVVPERASREGDDGMFAILDAPAFADGTIQVDVAGAPAAGVPPDSRGFIGVSFRTGPHGAWTQMFYLRPTNGRADDQLRRNHAVQYVAEPEWPWPRLRKELPGVYESYADMEAGAWTTMKIVVAGTTARLYVNGASQPCLVITDLKRTDTSGRIALWAHVSTDAYFGPVKVTPR
jgi:hypothetical protein